MDFVSANRPTIDREQLRYVCRQGGAQNGRAWMPYEIEQVKRHFPNTKKLSKVLPHRTLFAVRSQAGKLGLRKKVHRWRACDLTLLRKMWRTGEPRAKLEAALPDYSWDQIKFQARAHKLRRPDKELMPSGHAVIDQIKKRARELNMSMRDLDELAHSGRYFYSAAWLNQERPNPRYVAKAIRALDGELTAFWH
jgi:hypothetical protein